MSSLTINFCTFTNRGLVFVNELNDTKAEYAIASICLPASKAG
jgi:hypothetical protein